MSQHHKKSLGSKWLSKTLRLAIYLRDGLQCGYCNASLEQGVELSLDHIIPKSRNGVDDARNLITACKTCNSRRGDMPVTRFAEKIASGTATEADAIVSRVWTLRQRKINKYLSLAKEMIQFRGSYAAVIARCSSTTCGVCGEVDMDCRHSEYQGTCECCSGTLLACCNACPMTQDHAINCPSLKTQEHAGNCPGAEKRDLSQVAEKNLFPAS